MGTKELHERIRKIRKAKKWKMKEAAAAMGIGLHSYSRYENSDSKLRQATLVKIAKAFGCTLGQLTGSEHYDLIDGLPFSVRRVSRASERENYRAPEAVSEATTEETNLVEAVRRDGIETENLAASADGDSDVAPKEEVREAASEKVLLEDRPRWENQREMLCCGDIARRLELLNLDGLRKVLEYSEDLLDNPRFQK